MRLEYEVVDANRVCPGIQKVRVEPATKSVVATCYKRAKKKILKLKIIGASLSKPYLVLLLDEMVFVYDLHPP